MLIIGVRISCACLEENCRFPFPLSYCLAWQRVMLLYLKKHKGIACRITEIRRVCGGERKKINQISAQVLIPKQVPRSFHSLRFVMERLKTSSKKNMLGKKKIRNKLTSEIQNKLSSEFYKPTGEKGGRNRSDQ